MENAILTGIPNTSRNGTKDERLPNTTNIGFARLEAEAILLLLSEQGICASAGAACSSGSLEPSHVLKAMRIDPKIAHGAIRFSLSRYTTDAEPLTTLLAQNDELHKRVQRAAARTTALNERFLRRVSAELHDGPAQDLGLALLG